LEAVGMLIFEKRREGGWRRATYIIKHRVYGVETGEESLFTGFD
jgi:hypothetical protein